ncbi:hypothetical protein TNIN_34821 [Trichonephila inaurata madagascariensis]|uniref:Uncharacterized protein n=1 Tax=Trichonephila inaurata madagascariensis TaxID=2747483 RepID=A0A8X6YY06_9ARAC|nr:hypothetical protein TNIN_34821 [Trichonephila inaurata madagascariensis]
MDDSFTYNFIPSSPSIHSPNGKYRDNRKYFTMPYSPLISQIDESVMVILTLVLSVTGLSWTKDEWSDILMYDSISWRNFNRYF